MLLVPGSQALVQRMEPIFEPMFADCLFGYRPGCSPQMAMRRVWRGINARNVWVERGGKTGRSLTAQATAPLLDSTRADVLRA